MQESLMHIMLFQLLLVSCLRGNDTKKFILTSMKRVFRHQNFDIGRLIKRGRKYLFLVRVYQIPFKHRKCVNTTCVSHSNPYHTFSFAIKRVILNIGYTFLDY